MSPPGSPKGEYRSAQHEGTPMSRRGLRVAYCGSSPTKKGDPPLGVLGSSTPLGIMDTNLNNNAIHLEQQSWHRSTRSS